MRQIFILNVLQPGSFWIEKDTSVWFWNENFRHVRFWNRIWFNLLRENDIFAFILLLKKHDFELKSSLRVRFWVQKITTRQFLNLETNILRRFLNLKRIPCVTAWVKKFTKCQILNQRLTTGQILNWIFYKVSYFDCTSFAVCNVFMYSSKHSTFR